MKIPEPKPMLIAGADAPCEAGIAPLLSINPATGQTNYEVAAAGPETVDFAVRNAASACAGRGWRERLQMQENGKVGRECSRQVQSAAATFRYYAGVCEVTGSEVTPARGNYLSMTLHQPYRVVAAMTPWNSPMTMEAQKMAPALAAGNAVILKPSEVTPSTGLAVARIALQAGLPEGILNVLPGTGQGAGAALVAHPLVRMVSFTGGTESGRRIGEIAARKLMPVALELGGKSPHILFADADVDAAVAAVAEGIFEGSGQSCVAGSRLFVHESIHHVVLKKLLERARSLRVDLPDAPGAEMGPLAPFAQRDKVQAMVDEARAAGASILAGGTRPDASALANGAYYLPTIIAGIDNRARIAQQEIFGPGLCGLTFGNEEDLIAQANGTAFGLAAGIWTADYQRAWRVARALEAGTVWINTYKQLSVASPFGGFKDSGIGREKGIAGTRLYQQPKSIYFGMA